MHHTTHDAQSQKTRHDLIITAIRLMARDGIGAVSLRSVNSEAGCLNASAAHYHFGGKSGLVEAALRHVLEPVAARMGERFDALEGREQANGGTAPLCAVLEAACLPFLSLMLHPGYGHDAVRFVSRVMFEADETLQGHLNAIMAPTVTRAAALIAGRLPDLPPQVLMLRLLMLPTTIVYGTVNAGVIYNSPLGNVAPERPVEAIHRMLEYLEGALTCPASPFDPDLAERMVSAMPPRH